MIDLRAMLTLPDGSTVYPVAITVMTQAGSQVDIRTDTTWVIARSTDEALGKAHRIAARFYPGERVSIMIPSLESQPIADPDDPDIVKLERGQRKP